MDRIERIGEFLKASPNDSFLQHALALEFIKLGNDAAARQLFETILAREPGYIGSYYHLGKLLERTGETKLAIEWFEKGMAVAKEAGDGKAYGEMRAELDDLIM